MNNHNKGGFVRKREGMSRPRELAAAALEELKLACLRAGITEEELESNEQEVRDEIATNGRFTPPCLRIPMEEST